jgi:hypothetical protein
MVLREDLVDADIPRRDKMREVILGRWRIWFQELKLELSVSAECLFFPLCLPANFGR